MVILQNDSATCIELDQSANPYCPAWLHTIGCSIWHFHSDTPKTDNGHFQTQSGRSVFYKVCMESTCIK